MIATLMQADGRYERAILLLQVNAARWRKMIGYREDCRRLWVVDCREAWSGLGYGFLVSHQPTNQTIDLVTGNVPQS